MRAHAPTPATPVPAPDVERADALRGAGHAGRTTAVVGPADDAFEREADAVADRVVAGGTEAGAIGRGPDRAPLQREPMEEEEEDLQLKRDTIRRDSLADDETMHPKAARAAVRPGVQAGAPAAAAAVSAGGTPLSHAARAWFEPRFGRDLSHVRLHTDAEAGHAARGIGARAYTLRNHIAFAPGQFSPATTEGRRLIAHELTHTLQQAGGAAARPVVRRQPTSLAAIPEDERRTIRVSTTAPAMPDDVRNEVFTLMSSGRPGTTFSVGATNSFGTGIDAAFQARLGSAAAWFAGQTNGLPMGSSLETSLDLTGYGGQHRRYRFTRFNHATGTGAAATTAQVMLIEDAGAPVTVAQATGTVPATLTVGSNSYPLAGTWSNAEFSALRQAITLLPGTVQTSANALTFRRVAGAAPGAEAGHYDPGTDTVSVYDSLFSASGVLTGGQTPAVRNLLHEIGHALDLRPLEAAWNTFNAAGQTSRARRTFGAARSGSGSRWRVDSGGTWNREIAAADRTPAFRAAVRRDGVRDDTSGRVTPEGTTATLSGGVTTYSDTDYEEMFAEAFALYMTDPARLEQLRPATFAFMRTTFPRTP